MYLYYNNYGILNNYINKHHFKIQRPLASTFSIDSFLISRLTPLIFFSEMHVNSYNTIREIIYFFDISLVCSLCEFYCVCGSHTMVFSITRQRGNTRIENAFLVLNRIIYNLCDYSAR